MLGYRTLHKGDKATSDLVLRAEREDVALLSYVGNKFDAYLDVQALVTRFKTLDHQYPGSKFILTICDETSWLESRERHVLARKQRYKRGEYSPESAIDREDWLQERRQHHAAVRSYLNGRDDDLLTLDIRGGEGWETLAPFLDREPPNAPFPHENRAGRGTYRPDSRIERASRRATYVLARIRYWWGQ